MKSEPKFKSLLPTYPIPPYIPNLPGEECCKPFDYTKKFYHPHCCPGKRRRMESCSDHDYPGHFSSVIRYPVIPDRCNRKLPYEYYHYKKTVKSEYPWKIPLEKPHKIYKQKNVYSMLIPNYKKSDCGCGK